MQMQPPQGGPRGPEGHGPGCGHGPEGHGPEMKGHGPGCGHGPEGHGPEMKGHGPGCGHGPEGHGPEGRPCPKPMLSRERILVILADHDGGMRQKEIAEEMRVGAPSMSEFINRLEDTGYIERKVDPADKRATIISLTDKGAARAAEMQDEHQERFSRLFGKLTDDEKDQLIGLLDKLLAE